MNTSGGFEEWLQGVTPSLSGDDFVPPTLKAWHKEQFTTRRLLSREELDALVLHDQRIVADAALVTVLGDLERVRGDRPWMETMSDGVRVRVAWILEQHIIEEPPTGLEAMCVTEALVEVADAVIDLIAGHEPALPFVCPTHGFGLLPTLLGRRAVWWCVRQGHAVTEIGHLGESH
jgi:hypothetical protein